jgi:hypothetical protein
MPIIFVLNSSTYTKLDGDMISSSCLLAPPLLLGVFFSVFVMIELDGVLLLLGITLLLGLIRILLIMLDDGVALLGVTLLPEVIPLLGVLLMAEVDGDGGGGVIIIGSTLLVESLLLLGVLLLMLDDDGVFLMLLLDGVVFTKGEGDILWLLVMKIDELDGEGIVDKNINSEEDEGEGKETNCSIDDGVVNAPSIDIDGIGDGTLFTELSFDVVKSLLLGDVLMKELDGVDPATLLDDGTVVNASELFDGAIEEDGALINVDGETDEGDDIIL